MDAGRALDALVATKVMGWEPSIVGNYPWQQIPPGDDRFIVRLVPHYSTDIAAAWTVVDAMPFTTGQFGVTRTASDEYCAEYMGILSQDERYVQVYAETAPLAICLAALTASDEGAA